MYVQYVHTYVHNVYVCLYSMYLHKYVHIVGLNICTLFKVDVRMYIRTYVSMHAFRHYTVA